MLLRYPVLAFLAVTLATGAFAQDADRAPKPHEDATVALHAPVPLAAPGGLLYDNGPLVNSIGTGVGGADESVLQNSSLNMNTLGAGHQLGAGNRVADDFEVPAAGWDLVEIYTYAYQTGSPTTSTIEEVNLQIWDGSPENAASVVVFGDDIVSRLDSTWWSGIYRVSETTTGASADRPIMIDRIAAQASLAGGTYWLDWQAGGSLPSGPWVPPITITDSCTTGNSLQFTGTWAPLLDGGDAMCPQGLPFQLYGVGAVANEPGAGETPEGYVLSAAYPNPFNPQTALTLEVERTQHVSAGVYTLLGQRVATLFEGPVAAGVPLTLTFEAGALPSGSYVVRVDSETFSAMRPVTLLK